MQNVRLIILCSTMSAWMAAAIRMDSRAMSSHRPYRPSFEIDVALDEIERGRGIFYDSVAVDACLDLFRNKGYTLPI